MDRSNDIQQFLANHSFHHVALGSRIESAANIHIAFMGTQNNDSSVWKFLFHLFYDVEAAHIGQAEIHHSYVWTKRTKLLKPFMPRRGCARHCHIRLKIDDCREPLANGRVIVYA